jgi:MoaA/NifB/PqqE/SkfB family radical SAM enzyme
LHLAEVIELRAVPAAGLIIELTRRCPLSCAHCSTDSTLASEEHPSDGLLRLIDSFEAHDRPQVIALTGGEPLLRPARIGSAREATC